jgi:hypothetical protein
MVFKHVSDDGVRNYIDLSQVSFFSASKEVENKYKVAFRFNDNDCLYLILTEDDFDDLVRMYLETKSNLKEVKVQKNCR